MTPPRKVVPQLLFILLHSFFVHQAVAEERPPISYDGFEDLTYYVFFQDTGDGIDHLRQPTPVPEQGVQPGLLFHARDEKGVSISRQVTPNTCFLGFLVTVEHDSSGLLAVFKEFGSASAKLKLPLSEQQSVHTHRGTFGVNRGEISNQVAYPGDELTLNGISYQVQNLTEVEATLVDQAEKAIFILPISSLGVLRTDHFRLEREVYESQRRTGQEEFARDQALFVFGAFAAAFFFAFLFIYGAITLGLSTQEQLLPVRQLRTKKNEETSRVNLRTPKK